MIIGIVREDLKRHLRNNVYGGAYAAMIHKSQLLTNVDVDFLVPGAGMVTEKYSMLNHKDIACWKANVKLSGAIQLRVREAGFQPYSEELKSLLEQAKQEAEKTFEQLKKNKE